MDWEVVVIRAVMDWGCGWGLLGWALLDEGRAVTASSACSKCAARLLRAAHTACVHTACVHTAGDTRLETHKKSRPLRGNRLSCTAGSMK